MHYRIYNPQKLEEQIGYLQDNNITTLTQLSEKTEFVNTQFNEKQKKIIGTEYDEKSYSEYISLKNERKLLNDIKKAVKSALRRQTQKRKVDIER